MDLIVRCATTDRTPAVAEHCRALLSPATQPSRRGPEPIDAMVLAEDEDAPASAASFVLVRPDGLARFGVTGPSGWLHERPSLAGEFSVVDPAQLANEP